MNMSIRENIQQVRENIAAAALSAGFVGTAVGTFALTKTDATKAQIQKAQAAQAVLQAKLAK